MNAFRRNERVSECLKSFAQKEKRKEESEKCGELQALWQQQYERLHST